MPVKHEKDCHYYDLTIVLSHHVKVFHSAFLLRIQWLRRFYYTFKWFSPPFTDGRLSSWLVVLFRWVEWDLPKSRRVNALCEKTSATRGKFIYVVLPRFNMLHQASTISLCEVLGPCKKSPNEIAMYITKGKRSLICRYFMFFSAGWIGYRMFPFHSRQCYRFECLFCIETCFHPCSLRCWSYVCLICMSEAGLVAVQLVVPKSFGLDDPCVVQDRCCKWWQPHTTQLPRVHQGYKSMRQRSLKFVLGLCMTDPAFQGFEFWRFC